MKFLDVASLLTEKTVPVFSDIPALKLGRYFTGIAAEITAAIFPVERRYFSGKTPLTPLFSGKKPLVPLFFRFNIVNAAIFPVERQ